MRRLAKNLITPFRQYLRRHQITDRYLRGEGLEIGALQDPQRLRKGVKVRYVDIANTAELRRMYARKARRHLVEVDIVDDGERERLSTVAETVAELADANFRIHCWPQTDFVQMPCALQQREGFPAFDIAEFVANEREMVVVLKRSA
ncbi:MAG: hypothetical protein AB8H80_02510 [Planctomycetota bacterium]